MSKKNIYYTSLIENALKKHLSSENNSFPFRIQIDDNFITLCASSLRSLNEVFENYKDKLFDPYRKALSLYDNPNITLNDEPFTNFEQKTVNLNNLLVNASLSLITTFNNFDKDCFVLYKPNNFKPNMAISDFVLVPSNSQQPKDDPYIVNMQIEGYKLLSEFPLKKSLSKDANYFSIINSFLDKDILNPEYKYNYQLKNDIFKNKLPKEWKNFEKIFNKNNLSDNKNNTKIISSSLSKNGGRGL